MAGGHRAVGHAAGTAGLGALAVAGRRGGTSESAAGSGLLRRALPADRPRRLVRGRHPDFSCRRLPFPWGAHRAADCPRANHPCRPATRDRAGQPPGRVSRRSRSVPTRPPGLSDVSLPCSSHGRTSSIIVYPRPGYPAGGPANCIGIQRRRGAQALPRATSLPLAAPCLAWQQGRPGRLPAGGWTATAWPPSPRRLHPGIPVVDASTGLKPGVEGPRHPYSSHGQPGRGTTASDAPCARSRLIWR
jgi:hypothetical protein